MSKEYFLPLTRAEETGKKHPHLVRAAARIAVIAQWPEVRKCLFVRHQTKGPELPGGAIESGEVPIQTCLRELSEEAGMQLPVDIRLILIDIVPVIDHRGGSWLDIIYGTRVTSLQIAARQEAELPVLWLTIEEVGEQVDRRLSSYKTALMALEECMKWTSLRKNREQA